jgi:hypothetical protein
MLSNLQDFGLCKADVLATDSVMFNKVLESRSVNNSLPQDFYTVWTSKIHSNLNNVPSVEMCC